MRSLNNGKVRAALILLLFALPAAASLLYACLGHEDFFPHAVLIAALCLLFVGAVLMFLSLRRSLKVTLYSYKNIMLISGILFTLSFAVVLAVYNVPLLLKNDLSVRGVYSAMLGFPRVFSYYAAFVIFAVCVLLGVSNLALIRHEGFRLHNAMSLILAALYIGGTVAVYILTALFRDNVLIPGGFAEHPVWVWLATVLPLFLLVMLCYFECILVGTAIMGWKAARQVPSYDKDYIIILGCSINKKGGLLPLLKGRVNRAIRFAWEQEIATGKPLKYVPSGGQGPDEVMSEGSAMELYLLTRGAESYEVFPEKKSRNTYENMLFSREIIDGLCENAKIAFATTNYHMLRSGILARKVGIDAEGIAGDTKWYFWPNGFVREFFGIVKMNGKNHALVAAAAAILCAAAGSIGVCFPL